MAMMRFYINQCNRALIHTGLQRVLQNIKTGLWLTDAVKHGSLFVIKTEQNIVCPVPRRWASGSMLYRPFCHADCLLTVI